MTWMLVGALAVVATAASVAIVALSRAACRANLVLADSLRDANDLIAREAGERVELRRVDAAARAGQMGMPAYPVYPPSDEDGDIE